MKFLRLYPCKPANGTLYVGMTDDLVKRIRMHKEEVLPGFTKEYGVKLLVWYEVHEFAKSAFTRERQIRDGIEPGNSR